MILDTQCVYKLMPRYLTDQDIADFRAELCRVATERFARFGYEGVTMRQLAEALGCSPKTPYRYFKDKADILATVRAQACLTPGTWDPVTLVHWDHVSTGGSGRGPRRRAGP